MNKLGVLFVVLVCAASASALLPRGFTTFFSGASCPAGWQSIPSSEGRLIVSVADPKLSGLTVGEALASGVAPTHTHGITLSATIPSLHLAADSCCNTDGAQNGEYSGTGQALTTDSGLPFTQLQLCFLTRAANNLSVPYGSVSFYEPSTPACPGNWTPFAEAAGRAMLPGYDGVAPTPSDAPPLTSQEDRPHTHTARTTVTTDSISYVGIDGCCNDGPTSSGTFGMTGATGNTSSNIPYIQLLTCASKVQTFDAVMPPGAMLWSPELGCPNGWTVAATVSGRFLVSLPAGGQPGASFGGSSVPAGSATPVHAHQFNGTILFPSVSVGLASGCCAGGYAGAGVYPFEGNTDSSTSDFPFLQVPLCVQIADLKN